MSIHADTVCPPEHIVKLYLCPLEHIFGDIVSMGSMSQIKAMHERIKTLVARNCTTIEDALTKTGMSLNTYNTQIQNERFPRANSLFTLARNLKTTVEFLLDGTTGLNYIIAWAEENGARWKPPPRMVPLIDAAEKLSDTELKKLIEIAKICKTEALESSPQSKTG